jgi:hypothetical protein
MRRPQASSAHLRRFEESEMNSRPASRLSFVACSFVLAAAAGCNCRAQSIGSSTAEIGVVWHEENGPELVNRDAVYDFGTAFVGEKIPKKLIIRNIGSGPLRLVSLERIEGASVSIGADVKQDSAFDVRFEPDAVVESTVESEIDMFFTPRGGSDYFVKLTLTADGTRADEKTATILLKGKGEGGACDLPELLDFGQVPVGDHFTLPVALKNPGTLNSTSTVGDIEGLDATSFDVAPKGAVAVPAATTLQVAVGFSPTQKRAYSGTVKMKGGGDCPEKTIILKGEGVDDVLTWTPSSFDYGYVSPSAEASRQVIFTNTSKVAITLTDVVTTMPSDFFYRDPAGNGSTSFTVPGGGVPTPMTVSCKPTGLGARNANLTFQTHLTKVPSGAVALKCYGGGPRIKVTPRPTLNFGKVAFYAGAPIPVTRKITALNVGTRPPNGDVQGNLFFGKLVGAVAGQLPLMAITPGANTTAAEFQVGIPNNYDTTKGLEAAVGKNLADLSVTLTPSSPGMKEADLIIFSNDSAEPEVKIHLVADAQTLPPCNLQVTPLSLNFGLVSPPAFKELPLTITNLGQNPGDLCYLSGIEIASGSDTAYTLVGGTIDSKELQPAQSLQVMVRVSPPGPITQTLTTHTGALTFSVNSPSKPVVSIPLTTSVGPACLAIAPDDLDFGAVKPGCNSSTRTFSAYNVCNVNITLTGFTVQAGAGQPAGGPNCPGATYCPEFLLVSTPAIPTGGLTLLPGSAPITFQAKYRPIDIGQDNGAIALQAIQSGQNLAYLVNLRGTGDAMGLQTDSFTQDLQPKADILLTVDDSGSMGDKQTNLSNNFTAFIQYAAGAGVDYQLGVTTTWDDVEECAFGFCVPAGPGGRLLGSATNPKILTPSTPMVAQKFQQKVVVGTNGGTEKGLTTSLKALTPPLISNENAGFLRYDANLAVVVVSDAGDQSVQPYSYFYNRFLNIKGFNRASMFTFNDIGPTLAAAPNGCTYDDYTNAASYQMLANATNGVISEICTNNWSQKLQDLGKTAFGFRTVFYLTSAPDLSGGKTLTVKINGVAAGASDFTYDASINAIKFDPLKTPGAGKTLTVTYFTACL